LLTKKSESASQLNSLTSSPSSRDLIGNLKTVWNSSNSSSSANSLFPAISLSLLSLYQLHTNTFSSTFSSTFSHSSLRFGKVVRNLKDQWKC
jgi:hypothetical protein